MGSLPPRINSPPSFAVASLQKLVHYVTKNEVLDPFFKPLLVYLSLNILLQMSTNHGDEIKIGDSNNMVALILPSNGCEVHVLYLTGLERRRKSVSEPIPASPYCQIQV